MRQVSGQGGEEAAVADALRRLDVEAWRTLGPTLACVFAAFVVADWLTLPPPARHVMPWLDLAGALAMVAVHGLARRDWGPRGHAFAGLAFLTIVPYLAANLLVTGNPVMATPFALYHVTVGILLLSTRWAVACVAAADVAWAACLPFVPASADTGQFGLLLLSSSALALVAQRLRRGTITRLEALRVEDARKRAALETALQTVREAGRTQAVAEMKERFLNTAAHELATPMTPLVIQAGLLSASDQSSWSEGQRRAAAQVGRSVARLAGLLQDVLDSTRLQSGALPLRREAVDLGALVREAVETLRPAAQEAGVAVEPDLEPGLRLDADAPRLSQAVTALVSNAIKFSARGGRVEIRAWRDGDSARVRVRDHGIGMAPGEPERLFAPFVRLHPEREGVGLGLYLARGIVERHGGTLSATSAGLGQGSTFEAVLPVGGR